MKKPTVLPPQPTPKRLTARHAIETLGEHYRAFLLANNLSGFLEDPDTELKEDRIGDMLIAISCSPGMTTEEIFEQAKQFQELSQNELTFSKAVALVLSALNYQYAKRRYDFEPNGYFPNRWDWGDEVSQKYRTRTEALGDLPTTYRVNEIRSRQILLIARDAGELANISSLCLADCKTPEEVFSMLQRERFIEVSTVKKAARMIKALRHDTEVKHTTVLREVANKLGYLDYNVINQVKRHGIVPNMNHPTHVSR